LNDVHIRIRTPRRDNMKEMKKEKVKWSCWCCNARLQLDNARNNPINKE
jgi:hypothetical protein